jgi:putative lipoprotein
MTAAHRFQTMTCLCALLALAACSSKTPEQPQVATPAPSAQLPPTNELSSGPVDEAPAESGLAIKRGIATAAGDHGLFRSCDDKAELWLVDEADGTLTQLLTESGAAALYVEAYGERAAVPDELPAAKGQAGVFTLEQLLYAAPVTEGRGCDQAAADYIVTARGNEPFWSVTVAGTSMIWKQPDAAQGVTFNELQSEDAEGTVTYQAAADGRKLQLIVEQQPCRDSMSGDFFAFTAKAELDGKEFKGCARVGSQEAP